MKEEIKNHLIQLFSNHKCASMGAILGLVLAILFMSIGFFKTLLLTILIAVGFYIGHQIDRDGYINIALISNIIARIKKL